MKNKYIAINLILLTVFLLVMYKNNTSLITNKDSLNEVSDYFTSPIKDITTLLNDEINGYVYFGRDTCEVCLHFNSYLEKEFKKNQDLMIYKFDTEYWRPNDNFQKILNKYNITTIPSLIKISTDNHFSKLNLKILNGEDLGDALHLFLTYK
ncbi:MAG: thioredoxin family protein [Sarcina sp.]